jgi:hypothetical protein
MNVCIPCLDFTELSPLQKLQFLPVIILTKSLASNYNLGDWNSTTLDKYGCLPWNIQQQKMKNSRLHFLLTQSNSLFLTKDPKNLSKVIMLISLLIQWSRPILLKTNFKLSKYFQPGEVLLCSTSMRTNLHVVLWSVAS